MVLKGFGAPGGPRDGSYSYVRRREEREVREEDKEEREDREEKEEIMEREEREERERREREWTVRLFMVIVGVPDAWT